MITRKSDQYKVKKGWGYELWLKNFEKYCGKLLFFRKGKKSSWHYHRLKEETLYLHSGQILIFYGFDEDINNANQTVLYPGDSFHILPGLIHRFVGIKRSYLYEFSTQHFDEDSIRILHGD